MNLTRTLTLGALCLFAWSAPLAARSLADLHPYHDTSPDPGVVRADEEMEGPQMMDSNLNSAMSAARAHALEEIPKAHALALAGLGLILGLAWWQERHWHRQLKAARKPGVGGPALLQAHGQPHNAKAHEQWQRAYQANRKVFAVRWDGQSSD